MLIKYKYRGTHVMNVAPITPLACRSGGQVARTSRPLPIPPALALQPDAGSTGIAARSLAELLGRDGKRV